jgi:hypothetical protein
MSTYVDPNPNTMIGRMRQIAYDLLQEHARDKMIPTSIRFLFYELVSRGIISKSMPEDDTRAPSHRLTGALTMLREGGHIPWDWLVDETRAIDNFIGSTSIKAWTEAVLDQARIDPWDGDPPLVLVESRSLAGVLRHICDRYAVRLASTNGQVGGFLRTDIIPILEPNMRVLYFGDWDLAGGDIEANTRRVLEQEWSLRWERVALTEQQVRKYSLPVIIKYDRRYKDRRPHQAVESEALSQKLIVALLTTRLNRLLPQPLKAVLEREKRERAVVRRLLNQGR